MSKVNYLRILIIILPLRNNIFMGMSHWKTTAFLAKKNRSYDRLLFPDNLVMRVIINNNDDSEIKYIDSHFFCFIT